MKIRPFLISQVILAGLFINLSGAEPKIVGGTVAGNSEFGFAAALLSHGIADAYDAQNCGGALIHPYWVVTAAHCVEGVFADELDVLIGASDLNTPGAGQRIRVAEIFRHPDFINNDETLDNDVALLLLQSPAAASRPVLPLIEDTRLALPGTAATVIGWGNTSPTGNPSTVLRKVVMPILDNALVNQPTWLNNQVTATMLAAGSASGGTDSCQGDSGGPLIVPGPGGLGWRLAGVVSWGDGCAEPRHPGVYARVSRYRQWIQGFVWPEFTSWELANNIGTESPPDADRDGLAQWIEYAIKSNPQSGIGALLPIAGSTTVGGLPHASFSFRRRIVFPNVSLTVKESSSLNTWTTLDQTANLTGSPMAIPGEPDMELITVRSSQPVNPPGKRFFRLEAAPSMAYFPTRRPLVVGSSILSRLNPFDPTLGTSYLKEFTLSGATPGVSLPLKAESTTFRPILTVVNAATAATIVTNTAPTNGIASLSFTPAAGVSYLIRVTSLLPLTSGYFGLLAGIPSSSVPVLAVPGSVNGSLTTSDEVDPDFLPDFYRYDLYQLSGTTANRTCRVRMISSSVDSQIYILDDSGTVIADNDDFGNSINAQVDFTPLPGRTYQVFATTALQNQTGPYSIIVSLP